MKLLQNILFYFLFTLQVTSVCAQSPKVQWGPETEADKKLYPARFVGRDARSIYFVKDTYNPFCPFCPTDQYLEKYDAETLSLIYSKELKMPEIGENRHVHFEDLICLNGKLLLFTSFYNKESNISTAYVQHVTPDGEPDNDRKQLDEVSAENKGEKLDFIFLLSTDSSKILVFKNQFNKKGTNTRFSYKIIDQDLNDVYQNSTIELPFVSGNFTVHDYVLDKGGNFYMLTETVAEKSNWFKDRPSYLYKILLMEPNNSAVKEFDIQLEGKTISDMSFKINSKQDLVAAGFFSNKGRYSDDLAGTFYLCIDGKTREVKSKGFKDFEKGFLQNVMSVSKAKRGEELRQFKINHLLERSDGGAFMVAEQRYVQTYVSYNGRYTSTDYYYNFNDLIVASIDTAGKINWVKMVPKTQVTVNDKGPYSSYSLAISGSTANIIFNDNSRNLTIANPREFRIFGSVRKSTCVLVTLDAQGTMKRRSLLAPTEKPMYPRPKIYLQTMPNELLIYSDRGRMFKLMRVGFE